MDYFVQQRKSYTEINKVYFWTATINSWFKLMEKDAVKQIVSDSLKYLSDNSKNRHVWICCYAKPYSPHLENKYNEWQGTFT